ncbi:Alginate export [Williamwhitmania taraxaci]|uniref:Alginate export n=2 Tax=Williamwhitmania taraxaci TaxID=1640674 RepID=A0A1G6NPY7_9BACT|nr:Alginate export [Williamwhitmania taraxaci]
MLFVSRLFLVFLFIACMQSISAQVFKVDADLRNRFEYRDGYKKPASEVTDPTTLVYQRGRVAFSFKADSFQVQLSFQDARIWGQYANSTDVNAVSVHESWFRYWVNPSWSFKVGRQEISYDDQRIVGAPDWSIAGKSYDAALCMFEQPISGISASIGGGINRSSDDVFLTDYTKDYFRFFTVGYLKKSIGSSSSASLLSFVEGNQKKGVATIIYPRHTFGSNMIMTQGAYSSDLSLYIQHGQHESGAKVVAGAVALKGTYKTGSVGSLYIGGAYYTGTSKAELQKGKSNSFIRPYGTAHSLHGYMDYYTKLREIKDGGLVDIYVGYKCKFAPKWEAQFDYHYFSLAESGFSDAIAPEGYQRVTSKELGSEVDVMLSYQLAKSFLMQGGYSLMLQSSTAEKLFGIANGETSSWAYLSLVFRPRLFEKNFKQ